MSENVDETRQISVFMKDDELTLWFKTHIWFKWLPATPKHYADVCARMLDTEPDYSPCWWGMFDETPEEHGYEYIGEF